MRKTTIAVLAFAALGAGALPARADLLIRVDQSTQRMTVDRDGERLYEWPVSTGKPGYETPKGVFKPNRMDADHYSQEYDNAPMPHAIFFDLNGHAIHGSFDPIGKPAASHGCVRLAPANAAKLFALVSEQKMARTRVEIGGDVMVALRNLKQPAKTKSASRERRYPRVEAYGAPDVPPGYYVREPLPGAGGLFGFY
jgi:hypothetical protein